MNMFKLMFRATKGMVKIMCFLLAVLIIVSMFSGCGSVSETPTSVAVVIGNHDNSKTLPIQSSEVTSLITEAASTFGSVSIIVADGNPFCEASFRISAPSKSGLSDNKLRQIAEEQSASILQLLSQSYAVTAEVDTLDAISLAARSLKDEPDKNNKYILILDTGLSTTGSLNFTNNLIESDADILCEQLVELKAIPDLEDISVIWIGLGDTATPQQDLSPRQLKNLKTIWDAILTEGEAKTVYFSSVLSGGVISTQQLPSVSTVNLLSEPEILYEFEGTDISELEFPDVIIFNEERVAFIGDSSEFIDKSAAMDAIIPVAEYLITHPQFEVLIIGTTASLPSDPDYCLRLSQERADAVRDTLVELGVDSSQLQTIGLGYQYDPWHISDLNSDGTQNQNAGKNRKVVLLDAMSSTAKSLKGAY